MITNISQSIHFQFCASDVLPGSVDLINETRHLQKKANFVEIDQVFVRSQMDSRLSVLNGGRKYRSIFSSLSTRNLHKISRISEPWSEFLSCFSDSSRDYYRFSGQVNYGSIIMLLLCHSVCSSLWISVWYFWLAFRAPLTCSKASAFVLVQHELMRPQSLLVLSSPLYFLWLIDMDLSLPNICSFGSVRFWGYFWHSIAPTLLCIIPVFRICLLSSLQKQ